MKVAKSDAGWTLQVNGKPFYVKGAGVGAATGRRGGNYLELAKAMGANAVRTWGTDQGTQAYLDEAARQGLLVCAGIWINFADPEHGFTYLSDNDYLRKKREETLDYVRRFKDHPAVLMWGIGNEAIYWTQSEDERIAIARFIESLIREVHALDPDHPVVYASSFYTDLPYLKKYVPSLDIVGINVYGSVIIAEGHWKELGFDAPYLFTELGPVGSWDLPKDANGKMIESTEKTRAGQYRDHWNMAYDRRGKNLGGFVFHLGETTQESLTYWNINDGMHPKEPYLVLQEIFTRLGDDGVLRDRKVRKIDHAPKIGSWNVPAAAVKGRPVKIDVAASDLEGSALTYEFKASTAVENVLQYYVNDELPVDVKADGAHAVMTMPDKPGLYRLYAFARDAGGRSVSANRVIRVTES